MKKGKFLFFLLTVLCTFNSAKAQNIQFSQYYSAPMILGPSFAGQSYGTRFTMNYRDQWRNVPGVFTTLGMSFDHYFSDYNSGLGVLVLRDQAGSGKLSLTEVSMHYAYNLKMNRVWRWKPGFSFKYGQKTLDFYSLIFGDQIDPSFPSNGSGVIGPSIEEPNFQDGKTGFVDAAVSTLFHNEVAWMGLTADHLLTPNHSLFSDIASQPLLIMVYGGMRFYFEKSTHRRKKNDANISVSALYKNQMGYDQMDIGLYYRKSGLTAGLWYRGMPVVLKSLQKSYSNIDAVIFVLGYKINGLGIGYSYDFTVSKLINNTGGSHEISLMYDFDANVSMKNRQRKGQVPCPVF